MVGQFTKPLHSATASAQSGALSRPARALLPLAITLLLAGCVGPGEDATSPSPTDSAQSVEVACDVVRSSVADAATQLQQLDVTDPEASVAAISGVAEEIGQAMAAVQNADVAAILPGLQSGFAQAAEVLQAIGGGDLSKLPALQQATSDIQSALADFAALCTAP